MRTQLRHVASGKTASVGDFRRTLSPGGSRTVSKSIRREGSAWFSRSGTFGDYQIRRRNQAKRRIGLEPREVSGLERIVPSFILRVNSALQGEFCASQSPSWQTSTATFGLVH